MFESKYLKDDIQNIQVLFSIPTLRRFETEELSKLLRLSKMRRYEDGEMIIKEGEIDPWFYFLLFGKVRVSRKGVDIVTIDRKGEIFGELTLIDGMSRSASIHAIGDTACLAVDTASTYRLDTELDAAKTINMLYRVAAEYISLRLRITNEKLIEAQEEITRLKTNSGE